MANYIKYTNLNSRNFVPVTSRYTNSSVLYYGENNILTFTTYKKPKYTPTNTDKYTVVTGGTEYRPDLVSSAAYGTVDFWWKILEANGLKDVYEFKAGLNIVLPSALLG